MRDACIKAVETALGRPATQAELRGIEERVANQMRLLARDNPAEWSAKPEEERYTEAGKAAADELVAERERKVRNVADSILKHQAIGAFIDEQVQSGSDQLHLSALERVVRGFGDGRGGFTNGSADARANAAFKGIITHMLDALEAGRLSIGWIRFPFNAPGTDRMIRRALVGLNDGVPKEVQDAVKGMRDYIDIMVARINAAGGKIGRLEDWGEVHRWSADRLIRYMKKHGEAALVERFARVANRRRYVHADGRMMNDTELSLFMTEALRAIRTDGASKREAERARGDGPSPHARAVAGNKYSAHREIHLTPEGAIELLNEFSELGAMESMVQHARALARHVALLEIFGADYEAKFKMIADRALDQDLAAELVDQSTLKKRRADLDTLFQHVSGSYGFNGGKRLAAVSSSLRSIEAFLLLGAAKFASITDIPVMYHTAATRGLDAGKLWVDDVASWTGQGRRWAKRAGLLTDTVIGFADRYGYDNFNVRDLGAKAASFTMKTTGLNWDTEARRVAYATGMMDVIGYLVRKHADIASMKEDDVRLARFLNISQDVWDIWRLAKLDTRGQRHTLLTAERIFEISDEAIAAIRPGQDPALIRSRAADALLGVLAEETDNAVISAGAKDRAELLGDQEKTGQGTWWGELRRFLVLFKSFPWTFLRRQMEVARSIDNGVNRYAYAVSLFIAMSFMGQIANSIYDLIAGKDPRYINVLDPDPDRRAIAWRNVISGILRGGGLGVFGDLLFPAANPGARPQSIMSTLSGPVLSTIEDTYQLTIGNLNQAMMGEETDVGPEALTFAQRNMTPNLWYAKLPIDRLLFARMQEEINPGYRDRQQRRVEQTRGSEYWWPLAEPAPERAPDIGAAIRAN